MITIPPCDTDATVGESIVLPCQVSHDPSLDVLFSWSFNGQRIDFSRGIHHFERIGRVSFPNSLVKLCHSLYMMQMFIIILLICLANHCFFTRAATIYFSSLNFIKALELFVKP